MFDAWGAKLQNLQTVEKQHLQIMSTILIFFVCRRCSGA